MQHMSLDGTLAVASGVITKLGTTVALQREQIDGLQQRLAATRAMIAARDATIAAQSASIAGLRARNADLQLEINRMGETRAALFWFARHRERWSPEQVTLEGIIIAHRLHAQAAAVCPDDVENALEVALGPRSTSLRNRLRRGIADPHNKRIELAQARFAEGSPRIQDGVRALKEEKRAEQKRLQSLLDRPPIEAVPPEERYLPEIRIGDAATELRRIETESVQVCVTSPPYFGKRDYGVAGQIGLERTPDEFIERLRQPFSEAHRVLRPDGTLWVVIGDTYGSGRIGRTDCGSRGLFGGAEMPSRIRSSGRPKELLNIPGRLTAMLREVGFRIRQTIVWEKPNAMPDRTKDRFVPSHEYIVLATKRDRYLFNQSAIMEPAMARRQRSRAEELFRQGGLTEAHRRALRVVGLNKNGRNSAARLKLFEEAVAVLRGHWKELLHGGSRHPRSVWSIPTGAYRGTHRATFPPELARRAILAGSNPADLVLDMFLGAGTTGLVAHQLGRRCIGIELNPHYAIEAAGRIGVRRSAVIGL